MSRILKSVSSQKVEYLHQICARYFVDEHGFSVVEYNLGNTFTGNIDILATDGSSLFLITINRDDFAGSLLRLFMGYRWFKENYEFLRRIYPPEDVNIDLPVSLIVLSQEFPPDMDAVLRQVCSIPVKFYRYRLFGNQDDPDIFIEDIFSTVSLEVIGEQDLGDLRKELGIEPADLSDEEILGLMIFIRK
jgi:hypothetical protein